MSTGFECQIRELAPGKWYYVLQNWNCPVGAADWTDYAKIVGPYASIEHACEGLRKNEANPGGWSEIAYVEDRADYNAALLKRAQSPRRSVWR